MSGVGFKNGHDSDDCGDLRDGFDWASDGFEASW